MNAPGFQNHKTTQKSYDRLSRWYDLFTASERNIQRQAIQCLAPQPGESILEIGFGTGHTLLHLAGCVGPSGSVTGIDLSSGMARAARQRLTKASPDAKLTPITADAVYLPFRAGAFDGVISTFTLELFETNEIAWVLSECHRVLKPGSRLSIASLMKPATYNRAVAIYEWFHQALPALVDCRPIPVEQYILRAGFQISKTQPISLWGLPAQVVVAQK